MGIQLREQDGKPSGYDEGGADGKYAHEADLEEGIHCLADELAQTGALAAVFESTEDGSEGKASPLDATFDADTDTDTVNKARTKRSHWLCRR